MFNIQKPTVLPPKYSSDAREEEKVHEEKEEEDDKSETAHILLLHHYLKSSIITILRSPLSNTQNPAQNVPQPTKMMKKDLGRKKGG